MHLVRVCNHYERLQRACTGNVTFLLPSSTVQGNDFSNRAHGAAAVVRLLVDRSPRQHSRLYVLTRKDLGSFVNCNIAIDNVDFFTKETSIYAN